VACSRVMAIETHRDRIVHVLQVSSVPLDDDQLAYQAGIEPRQTVNQICRALQRQGVLHRAVGASGKIVNTLRQPPSPLSGGDGNPLTQGADSGVSVEQLGDRARPPGHSTEQRLAERLMLDLLGVELGLGFEPARIEVRPDAWVEIDGVDEKRKTLVECWAHQGSPKAAQRHKVLADAFKLMWVAHTILPVPRQILCMSDPAAAAPFQPGSRSWAARAFQDLGIELWVVELPEHARQAVADAQRRQYR